MTIYEHTTSLPTSAGEVSSVTLCIPGGLLKNVLVRALTDSTVFRANIVDHRGITRLNWDYHQGELNDDTVEFPMAGQYTFNITNASPDDTFQLVLSVQE